VGQKIDLEYNVETMRITDEDPEGGRKPQSSASDIMNKIRTTSQVGASQSGEIVQYGAEDITHKVVANVEGSKLKSLLSNIKAAR